MKRIFIGIKSSDGFVERVAKWRKQHAHLPVRFVRPENLHITLIPPWISEGRGDIIEKIRGAVQGVSLFDLAFTKISVVPDKARSRLIWAEGEESAPLFSLKRRVDEAFGRQDERAFLPHVTLARFEDGVRDSVLKHFSEETIAWPERVAAVTLFETQSDGTPYRIAGAAVLA